MDLAITHVGMVTSVGRDAATTCASIRAGITRPADLPGTASLDVHTNDVQALVGHPVTGVTDGFAAVARWLCLSERAVLDVLPSAFPTDERRAFWASAGLVLVTPMLGDARFQFDRRCQTDVIEETFVQPLLRRIDANPTGWLLLADGRLGLSRLFAQWTDIYNHLSAERLLVLAVDSLLDGMTLDWLGRHGRLRGPDRPDGLAPGEAAVALVVEPRDAARSRGAPPIACVHSILDDAAAAVPALVSLQPREPSEAGRALASVWAPTLTRHRSIDSFRGLTFADLNGESQRAVTYGTAFSLLPAPSPTGTMQSAAEWVGDTGAASAALHHGLAARALQRGYAPEGACVVLSVSDDGFAGGSLLTVA